MATLSPVIETATTVPTSVSIDPTPGIAKDAACDALISGSSMAFETFDELAWFSHHVVVGTVVERLPSQKAEVEGSALPFTIVTDVIVEVEHQLRGHPAQTLRVRTLGGSIDQCAQEFPDSPQPEPGTRVLLFLRESPATTDTVGYEIFGSFQGYWEISEDGLAETRAAHLMPAGEPIPLASIEAEVSAALADGPPTDSFDSGEFLVPIDEAPITPGPWIGTPTASP